MFPSIQLIFISLKNLYCFDGLLITFFLEKAIEVGLGLEPRTCNRRLSIIIHEALIRARYDWI